MKQDETLHTRTGRIRTKTSHMRTDAASQLPAPLLKELQALSGAERVYRQRRYAVIAPLTEYLRKQPLLDGYLFEVRLFEECGYRLWIFNAPTRAEKPAWHAGIQVMVDEFERHGCAAMHHKTLFNILVRCVDKQATSQYYAATFQRLQQEHDKATHANTALP